MGWRLDTECYLDKEPIGCISPLPLEPNPIFWPTMQKGERGREVGGGGGAGNYRETERMGLKTREAATSDGGQGVTEEATICTRWPSVRAGRSRHTAGKNRTVQHCNHRRKRKGRWKDSGRGISLAAVKYWPEVEQSRSARGVGWAWGKGGGGGG